MVSIRRSIDALEQRENALSSLTSLCRWLLHDLDEKILSRCVPRGGAGLPEYATRILEFLSQPTAQQEVLLRRPLSEALSGAAEQILKWKAGVKGLEDAVALLELATQAIQCDGANGERRLRDAATEITTAANIQDPELLRRRLRLQALELVAQADKLAEQKRAAVEKLQYELDSSRRQLLQAQNDALTDALTGLLNRRGAEETIREWITRNLNFSLVLIDLNRFKHVNDTHGHHAGDDLLRAFGGRLRGNLRNGDAAARWGGDEFMVLLPCGLNDAIGRVRTLQPALCGRFTLGRGENAPRVELTASFGVADRKVSETAEELFHRADRMLYADKASTS